MLKLISFLFLFPALVLSQKYITRRPYLVDSFLVSRWDLPSRLTYTQAKAACEELGEGWRLPTQAEWIKICENKEIRGFSSQTQLVNDMVYYEDTRMWYWTGEEWGADLAWIFCKDNREMALTQKKEYLYTRAVRKL